MLHKLVKDADYLKTIYVPYYKIQTDVYQRELNVKKARLNASRYDPALVNPVKVGYRSGTDSYACVDGQHTMEMFRILVEELGQKRSLLIPCRVVAIDDFEREAWLFGKQKWGHSSVKAYDLYKSDVYAGTQPATDIEAWLKSNRFRMISGGSKDHGAIRFISDFIRSWERDQTACKKAILSQREMFLPDEGLVRSVHNGLFYLYRHNKIQQHHIKKLQRIGRRVVVTKIINKTDGGSFRQEKAIASVLADLLNKGVRVNMVTLDD